MPKSRRNFSLLNMHTLARRKRGNCFLRIGEFPCKNRNNFITFKMPPRNNRMEKYKIPRRYKKRLPHLSSRQRLRRFFCQQVYITGGNKINMDKKTLLRLEEHIKSSVEKLTKSKPGQPSYPI